MPASDNDEMPITQRLDGSSRKNSTLVDKCIVLLHIVPLENFLLQIVMEGYFRVVMTGLP